MQNNGKKATVKKTAATTSLIKTAILPLYKKTDIRW